MVEKKEKSQEKEPKQEESKKKAKASQEQGENEQEESLQSVKDEEEREREAAAKKIADFEHWKPKTGLGNKVKSREIKDIDQILDQGMKILEPEIVDILLPDLETDLLLVGQSKGKFGGGQRRIFKQTQKKTNEGNKPKFVTMAVAGNKNGYVGVGYGKSRETVPAREKAIRNAKLNVMKIFRGCGSWQCKCTESHTIPFSIQGKCGSTTLRLIPAPKGTGLCIEPECGKILALAGIKDVWSQSGGRTKTKTNLILACHYALQNLMQTKIQQSHIQKLNLAEGKTKGE